MSATSPVSLALLQATDRQGQFAGQVRVSQWPVTVGRALDNDMVLGDSHLAAYHLRMDRNEAGDVMVEVLDTANGVTLDNKQHARGDCFAWPAGKQLLLGRLRLRLQLAEELLAAEEPLPRFRLRAVGSTMLAVGAMLAFALLQSWLALTEPSQLSRQLPVLLATVIFGVAGWAGVWALATKLFTGRLQFWRHVRIACTVTLAIEVVTAVLGMLAFMFSLESLARFELHQLLLGMAVAVYLHLAVLMPYSRRRLGTAMAGITLLLMAGVLGTSWLQSKRFTSTLYMSTFYPPGWRMAPAVPVKQFMDEAGDIRRRLDERLKDKDQEEDGPGSFIESE